MGSKRGDEFKRLRSLGEGTVSKESDYSEAPHRANTSRLVPTHQQDFLPCSFGFRPDRNAHQALQSLRTGIMERRGYWVLEVDIRKYFDSLPFAELRTFLSQRVTDGVVRRLIDKWLKAGVMEDGQLFYPTTGTPQGGVISPTLSNVFLHYVVDVWFAQEVQPRLRGPSTLVRYCDDFVMLFASQADAQRVHAVLARRLEKFGLQLHPDKTQLLDFRPRRSPPSTPTTVQAASFVFLGFLHTWATSRKGYRVVRQFTARNRLARALKTISQRCRRMRHGPLPVQHRTLSRILNGHYAYFGITGNSKQLSRFRHEVQRLWRKWLSRRTRGHYLSWDEFTGKVLQVFPLPKPRIVHRYASQ